LSDASGEPFHPWFYERRILLQDYRGQSPRMYTRSLSWSPPRSFDAIGNASHLLICDDLGTSGYPDMSEYLCVYEIVNLCYYGVNRGHRRN